MMESWQDYLDNFGETHPTACAVGFILAVIFLMLACYADLQGVFLWEL